MCENCKYTELVDTIDELLEDEDGRFEFAEETLEGIREWVEENEHCTDNQRRAVENIIAGVENA